MQIKYSLHDGKAESGRSGPGFATLFGTIKTIEKSWYVSLRDATTRVGNATATDSGKAEKRFL